MYKIKNILIKLFSVPLWLTVLLSIFSAVALTFIFLNGLEEAFYAYITYLVSAYSLTSLCVYCCLTLPVVIKNIKNKVYSNKYFGEYLSNNILKAKVSLYVSLIINLIYIFVNAFSTVYYRTAWFGIFAVYYFILALMRFMLAHFLRRCSLGSNIIGELKCAKICSLIMLTLNFALTATVLMMVYQGRGFEQHGILIYIIALYTFYTAITAVIEVVKNHAYDSPVLSTNNMIKFAEALVSVLLLETSMFAQFGAENSAYFKRVMIELTGGGIAVIITVMSVYMFVSSVRKLKSLKK